MPDWLSVYTLDFVHTPEMLFPHTQSQATFMRKSDYGTQAQTYIAIRSKCGFIAIDISTYTHLMR